ncbi:protein FAM200A-like [Macrobrachium nipponense]|uniref:protein FAM200A-like n=1 Tax=Macrobrachium nipponense TaxID=159736 RepID=UPI0030C7BCC8
MASYVVAYLIAQGKKPHTIVEVLIIPAALAMCRDIPGEKMAHELESIPMSNNTVGRRIHKIPSDILIQLMERVKNVNCALQLDESTDISSSSQLLAFVRYSFNGKLNEDMLFCLALEGKCTGDDIFMALDQKLHELGLSWDRYVGICTGEAGTMLGKNKGLKAKVHNVAPHIRFTHCIIHREALACKAIVPELKAVFDTAVKIVNYIKSRPLNARLFAKTWAQTMKHCCFTQKSDGSLEEKYSHGCIS